MEKVALITLINEDCEMIFHSFGAEWRSWISRSDHHEHMWSADPGFWGKVSPVLFPIVGALKDNLYRYGHQQFTMPRHGFARDKNFQVVDQSDDQVTFMLTDDSTTQVFYPFSFRLFISYKLLGDGLECTYTVENLGDTPMPFSIGAHPAFAVPAHKDTLYEDYYLEFESESALHRFPLDASGLILPESKTMDLEHTHRLPLSKTLFYEDAIVLKQLASQRLILGHRDRGATLRFEWDHFPYFGIWAAKDADFVCLEPWCGIADSVNADGDIMTKEGIIILDPDDKFARSWQVHAVKQ